LIKEIKRIAQERIFNKQALKINQNKVEVHLNLGSRPSGKKIVGVVPNQNSSPDILENVIYILSERINDKITKCQNIAHKPLWLALFNDNWLADPDTYKLAMRQLSISHIFDKIFLVLGNKEVHTL
jgi:hypothetical protein